MNIEPNGKWETKRTPTKTPTEVAEWQDSAPVYVRSREVKRLRADMHRDISDLLDMPHSPNRHVWIGRAAIEYLNAIAAARTGAKQAAAEAEAKAKRCVRAAS